MPLLSVHRFLSGSREWGNLKLFSYHIYRGNSNKWWQYKILLQIFISDDNKQFDCAREIWYGGKL